MLPPLAGAVARDHQRRQRARQRLQRVGAGLERRAARSRAGRRGTRRRARRAARGRSRARRRRRAPSGSASAAASAARSSSLLTSSSSTSAGSGSFFAARSVIRRTRPKLVSTTSAPCALGALGDRVGDRVAVDDPGDDDPLAARGSQQHPLAVDDRLLGGAVELRRRRRLGGPPERLDPGPDDGAVRPGLRPASRASPASARRRARAPARPSSCTRIVSPIRTGRLKLDRVEAAQRDHPLGVERHQADGVGEHQHPVGDALAEAARWPPTRRRRAGGASRRSGPRTRPGRPR